MLRFLAAVLRVFIGFVVACLAAGFVQVLFAVTPAELMVAGDARLGEAVNWGLLTATQIAVFAAPFAFIAILVSEWQGLRSFAFHVIVAMAISVAGFGLIHATESAAEASIVNSYAMAAYLTSGFVGGLFYWIFAGRRARRFGNAHVRMESDRKASVRDAEPGSGNAVDRGDAPPPRNARADQRNRSGSERAERAQTTVPETMPQARPNSKSEPQPQSKPGPNTEKKPLEMPIVPKPRSDSSA